MFYVVGFYSAVDTLLYICEWYDLNEGCTSFSDVKREYYNPRIGLGWYHGLPIVIVSISND